MLGMNSQGFVFVLGVALICCGGRSVGTEGTEDAYAAGGDGGAGGSSSPKPLQTGGTSTASGGSGGVVVPTGGHGGFGAAPGNGCGDGCMPYPSTGGAGGSGPVPADPYTCFARQAAGEEPPPPPNPISECGSWQGGPLLGYCVSTSEISVNIPWMPQDVCATGELCYPKLKVDDPRSCFAKCVSPVAGDSACLPTYLVEAPGSPGAGFSSILGQVTCNPGETCTPCISPLDGQTTGACDN